MLKHEKSHLDHNLTPAQIDWIFQKFADKHAFFLETVELPEELGTVPCGLYGPIMGDAPFIDVTLMNRGPREWCSRMVNLPVRQVRTLTVIGGPIADVPCALYTCYGGPAAPQEPDDPMCRDKEASTKFWNEHALAI